jgi:hypothetical protein
MNHLPCSRALAAAVTACSLAGAARAQMLNEVFFNPPGSDNGFEAVEFRGTPGASLAGLCFLAIDGDSTAGGMLDTSIDLSAYSFGTNGLLLIRDAATVLVPAPDAGTSVVVLDFVPDIENGSITFVLASGAAPAVGTDYDVENDGVIDGGVLPGLTIIDMVGILENDASVNLAYADDFGFPVYGPFDGTTGPASHNPQCLVRVDEGSAPCVWVGGGLTGTSPGPYSFNIATNAVFGMAAHGITALSVSPGVPNVDPDSDGDGTANGCDGCPGDPAKTSPGACGCGVPEGCSLGIDIGTISAAAGGTQALLLYGGAANAGAFYFMLGSVSGTAPGTPVDSVVLPLNIDAYLLFLLSNPNTVVVPSSGFLDGVGNAVSSFTVPAGASLTGLPFTVHHAYLLFDFGTFTFDFASNAAPVVLDV